MVNNEEEEAEVQHPTQPLPRVTLVTERDAELAKVAEELEEINRRITLIAAQVRWIQRAGQGVPHAAERKHA